MIIIFLNTITELTLGHGYTAGSVTHNRRMKTPTKAEHNRNTACINLTCPTYNMCSCHHSLFSLLALAVKPTVIDVGIYVNSIGPVSSIDMVSQSIHSHPLSFPSHTRLCPLSDIFIGGT